MKKNLFQIALILSLGLLLTSITGCKKEGCINENAENYDSKAKEDDGSCTFESDKFIGNYVVTEVCDGSTKSYGLTINSNGSDPSRLSMYNLGDFLGPAIGVDADVNGNDLSFHTNVLGATFSGEGTLEGNTLTIDYSINDFGEIEACIATCEK